MSEAIVCPKRVTDFFSNRRGRDILVALYEQRERLRRRGGEEAACGYNILRRLGLNGHPYDRARLRAIVCAIADEGLGAELGLLAMPEPAELGIDAGAIADAFLARSTAHEEALYLWSLRAWLSACEQTERAARALRLLEYVARWWGADA